MSKHFRRNWYRKIQDVIRSRHYTWLGLGLGGTQVAEAMISLTTDVMHVCKREGIDIDWLIEQSKVNFEQEETSLGHTDETRRAA